jgi:hypothetical protein
MVMSILLCINVVGLIVCLDFYIIFVANFGVILFVELCGST